MKYGIEVNVQKNHIATFPKPTLHFRVMRFIIMLYTPPALYRPREMWYNGGTTRRTHNEKTISDFGGGGRAVVACVCGRQKSENGE